MVFQDNLFWQFSLQQLTMLIIYIWSLNHDVKSTLKASNIFMLYYGLFWMNPLNNASITNVPPLYNHIIPFILMASAHYEPRFIKKNQLLYPTATMDYITNITLWHITILFNSGEMKKKKNSLKLKLSGYNTKGQKSINQTNCFTISVDY